jgi:hypothetical protein
VREWEENVEKALNEKAEVELLKAKKQKGGTKGMSYFLEQADMLTENPKMR